MVPRIRILPTGKDIMKQSQIFRDNAENCAHLAESAGSDPTFNRYRRMEAAWRALADEQDWLDGEVSPSPIAVTRTSNRRSARLLALLDHTALDYSGLKRTTPDH